MTPSRSRRAVAAVATAAFLLLLAPGAVLGHAELDTVDPGRQVDGPGTPTEIVLTFTETLDPSKSSIKLADCAAARSSPRAARSTRATRKTMRLVDAEPRRRHVHGPLDLGLGPGRRPRPRDDDVHGDRRGLAAAVRRAVGRARSARALGRRVAVADGRPERRPVPVGAADDARHLDQRRDHPDRRGPGRPRRARDLAPPRPGTRSRSRRGVT